MEWGLSSHRFRKSPMSSPSRPIPLAGPAAAPFPADRPAEWRWWFRGTYAVLLLLGFAVGYLIGSPRSSPPSKPAMVIAAKPTKPEPTSPPETKPEPKAKPVETKVAEAKPSEPEPPEPKPAPEPPPKKAEPKPEPNPEPKKSAPPAKPANEVTFAKLAPVFKDKCGGCHGGANLKGGLDLRSAKTTIAGGDNGEAVKPGDPDNSLLWQSVRDGTMPPKGKPKLTEEEKRLIKDWIADGAK